MAIILPHTAADIPFFRSNGVCYQRISQGVTGTPDTTWDSVADQSDFGIYASCEDCHNAVFVPSVCPCSSFGTSFPCGDPEDLYYERYECSSLADIAFAGITPLSCPIDQPVWNQQVYYDESNYFPSCGLIVDQYNMDNNYRIPGTSYACKVSYSGHGLAAMAGIVFSTCWYFRVMSGVTCGAIWKKTTGNSPTGIYTLASYGETIDSYTNYAISPTTIELTPVIP